MILLQPGDDFFPKDEHGNLLVDPVDLCDTWEVSPQRKGHRRGHCERMSQVLPPRVRTEYMWLNLEVCSFHKRGFDGLLGEIMVGK